MKKQLFYCIGLLCWFPFQFLIPLQLFAQVNSRDGRNIDPHTSIRSLNVFVNVIFDISQPPNTSQDPDWPYNTQEGINLTTIGYIGDFIDPEFSTIAQTHGLVTRMFAESSFGEFVVTGDVIVVDIRESTILNYNQNISQIGISRSAIRYISDMGGLTGKTMYGYTAIQDFDTDGNGHIDLVNFYIRNIPGSNAGSGQTLLSGLNNFINQNPLITSDGTDDRFDAVTIQIMEALTQSENYRTPVIHEIGHNIWGDNTFHAGGGQHNGGSRENTFLGFQGGYGLMGGANSSLCSTNGYERWRADWRHSSNQQHRIGVNGSDSDIQQSDGNQTFFLRDFVTYGDAIRIELPYVDPGTPAQYIWLENHQVGSNGKLDFFQYSQDFSCIPDAAGIYAYYQVGKTALTGTSAEVFYEGNFSGQADNLKMITAEGYFDMAFEHTTEQDCAHGNSRELVAREAPNPFSGAQDQARLYDRDYNGNGLVPNQARTEVHVRRDEQGNINDALVSLGDEADAFTDGDEISMSTNPASVNTLTFYTRESGTSINPTSRPNNLHTYLTGLNISISAGGYHNEGQILRVDIRWDDYYVDQDVRWCSNIILKEELHLVGGRRILLDQGRNPFQKFRDNVSNEYFPPTEFTCEPSSLLEIQAGGEFVLRNQSSIKVENGASLVIRDEGVLRVEEGCRLDFLGDLIIEGDGRLIIECGASAEFDQNASVSLQDPQSLILYHELATNSIPPSAGSVSGQGSVQVIAGNTQPITLAYQTFNSDEIRSGKTIFCYISNVQAPAKLTLFAKDEIVLSDDFEVAVGAELETMVTDCN